jgi:hypothetical protein
MRLRFSDTLGERPNLRPYFSHRIGRSLLAFLAFVVGTGAQGWEDHFRITQVALQNEIPLSDEVIFSSLSEALRGGIPPFAAKTEDALKRELKISKKYTFPLHLGETPGRPLPKLTMLVHYSDEPDWGADDNLFDDDEYPELWTRDSPYVAVRRGTGSRGFRHMYFPGKFRWTEPIGSFQIPPRPLGEAPRRAKLFLILSRAFFEAGHPYWGVRFLAWTLHYLEDLYQPYHSRQTPTKRLVRFQWKGWLPSIDIAGTARQISYYHFGFERWADSELTRKNPALTGALAKSTRAPSTILDDLERFAAEDLVAFANDQAGQVGRGSYHGFPSLPEKITELEAFIDSDVWKTHLVPPRVEASLIEATEKLFTEMGSVLREVVLYKKK